MPEKKRGKKKSAKSGGLEGLDIHINEMGEVISNIDIAGINRFLDENTTDKKLSERQETPKENQEEE